MVGTLNFRSVSVLCHLAFSVEPIYIFPVCSEMVVVTCGCTHILWSLYQYFYHTQANAHFMSRAKTAQFK